MNPALSVLLFTTLSGAGLGVLLWTGALLAWSPSPLDRAPALLALCVGVLLLALGLGSSFFHLGQPLRAWRAFSQWRTSWLSREAVVALATLVAASVCALALWRGNRGVALHLGSAALASMALLTLIATAGIYSSLKPIRAWCNGFVAPFLVFAALWSGGCVLWLVLSAYGIAIPAPGVLALLLTAGAGLAIKLRYWRFIDAEVDAPDASHVTGLGRNSAVRAAESPHTESNYLLREMGFVVVRRHAQRLRSISVACGFIIPAVGLLVAHWFEGMWSLLAVPACLAVIVGMFVERWLFFAQARHTVAGYYG